MKQRLDYSRASPKCLEAMQTLERHVLQSGLDHRLLELVKTRASQINGCTYCLDMHTKDARAGGETEQRLYALSAWRETPFFDERERAALAWTESVTLVRQSRIPDDVYESARKQFSEHELVDLTLAWWRSTGGTGSPSHFVKSRAPISRRDPGLRRRTEPCFPPREEV
jgi:AhpD family alkylhydroperoxidase